MRECACGARVAQGDLRYGGGFSIFFAAVKLLHTKLETDDFGVKFGLFLHFEMRLTLPKIQQIVEAACKTFHVGINRYKKKSWLSNPHNKSMVLYTPRIVPSRTKLEPVIKALAATLGVDCNENGLLAFRTLDVVLQEVLSRDTGKLTMPTLDKFYNGLRLPIIISRDATGKGSLQFTTPPPSAFRGPPSRRTCSISSASATAATTAAARVDSWAPTSRSSTR